MIPNTEWVSVNIIADAAHVSQEEAQYLMTRAGHTIQTQRPDLSDEDFLGATIDLAIKCGSARWN